MPEGDGVGGTGFGEECGDRVAAATMENFTS